MGAVTDLHDLAHEYLAACAAALTYTESGPPDRQLISPGPPAWDCCPQLSVHVASPSQADTLPGAPALAPGHRIQVQGTVYLVALVATILRCAPVIQENTLELPTPASITAAAKETDEDIWAIWNYIPAAIRAGTLFAPKDRETFVDPAVSLNQQGGCAGWQLQVRVQLDGFKPI